VMGEKGSCLVRFDVPRGVSRAGASGHIARGIDSLAHNIGPPRSLLVVGGETLRGLCLSLGTDHLCAVGQILPGVPVSRMVGGRWDGAEIVSKSGAFGDEALLLRISSPKE
jgi:D-threonate/D-erythronate kinase